MKTIIISLLLCCFYSVNAAEIARGTVYGDLNHNMVKNRNEKGIEGVAVSNGREVVLTDIHGNYEIAVTPGQILFVIKPAEYNFPVNEFNQPLFYYIYKPEGSPSLEFAGSSPTGKLPAVIDFPLIPGEMKDKFNMFVFGDPQPYTLEEIEYFRRGIVAEAASIQGVDMGVSLGDLVGDNLSLHIPYIHAVKEAGVPWFNVIGNHNTNYDGKADTLCDETYERDFGPATYSFNHGWVHFIVLDDILYPDPRGGDGYWGGFRPDQIDFIRNDLRHVSKDKLIILAFHIPISENEGGDPFRDEDRNTLFEILKDYPYTLTLSAHTHFQSQDFFTRAEGWQQDKRHHHFNVGASCGDWYSGLFENGIPVSTMRDGTPKGFAILKFDRNQYVADYKVPGKPAETYFSIHAPKVVAHNEETSAGIYANFYLGASDDKVYCRVDNGDWQLMWRISEYDPSYLHLLHEWDYADSLPKGRRPSNPEKCNHLWAAPVPTKLAVGEHTIEIKAVDMYGRTLVQKSSYRIDERR